MVEQTNGTLMLHRRLVREYEIRPASSVSRTLWASTANLTRPADRHHHPVLAGDRSPTVTSPSILDLITERETAAGLVAEQLREQVAALTAALNAVETELTELAITRKTLLTLANPTDPALPADVTVGSPAYQQILAVFDTTGRPMRAKDLCHALGTATTPKDTEGLRAKLKRLVAHQILTEPEPGLFTLTPPPPTATDVPVA